MTFRPFPSRLTLAFHCLTVTVSQLIEGTVDTPPLWQILNHPAKE